MTATATTNKAIEKRYLRESREISVERNDYLLSQVLHFIDEKRWFNLQPEYQRRNVWDRNRKSLFIESLILNLPVPPIFLYEPELNRYEVMDGQQRLSAILEYMKNRFALKGLNKWSELNKLRYDDLPPSLRRGFERRRISVVVLQPPLDHSPLSGDELRKMVFERLNTGGRALNAQEIRNCIYSSAFSALLVELSADPTFNDAMKVPKYSEHIVGDEVSSELSEIRFFNRMDDCEYILRFFAFRRAPSKIKGAIKRILDDAMEEFMHYTVDDLLDLQDIFESRLNLALELFGDDAFFLDLGDNNRPRRSAPLFDSIMVACDRLYEDRDKLKRNRDQCRQIIPNLLGKGDAYEIIVNRANTAKSTRQRLDLVTKRLATCL